MTITELKALAQDLRNERTEALRAADNAQACLNEVQRKIALLKLQARYDFTVTLRWLTSTAVDPLPIVYNTHNTHKPHASLQVRPDQRHRHHARGHHEGHAGNAITTFRTSTVIATKSSPSNPPCTVLLLNRRKAAPVKEDSRFTSRPGCGITTPGTNN